MEKLIETQMENKSKSSDKWTIAGVAFVGCMFLGIGVGMLFDAAGIGKYLGMGVGFQCLRHDIFVRSHDENDDVG